MKFSSRCSLWLGVSLAGLTSGCATGGVDQCASIPPGAIPEPGHVTVHRILETQAGKAEADDFVVYRHEFYLDGTELGPYGQYHLQLIARRLPTVPFPVLIQAVPDAKVNEQRRQTVVAWLKRFGHEDIEPRVIVGFPEAEGVGGEEAERIHNSLPQAGTGVNGYQNQLFNNNNRGGNFFGGPRSNMFRSGTGFSSFPF
jgi:hypothetical protein